MAHRTGTVDPPTGATRRVSLRTRRVIIALLLLIAPAITLGPFPGDLFDAMHSAARSASSWLPWDTGRHPTRREFEALLNFVIPIVLVLAVAIGWPRARPRLLFGGAVLATLCIEAVQGVLPGRFAQLRDVLLNCAGALVGTLIVVAAQRRFQRARPRRDGLR